MDSYVNKTNNIDYFDTIYVQLSSRQTNQFKMFSVSFQESGVDIAKYTFPSDLNIDYKRFSSILTNQDNLFIATFDLEQKVPIILLHSLSKQKEI